MPRRTNSSKSRKKQYLKIKALKDKLSKLEEEYFDIDSDDSDNDIQFDSDSDDSDEDEIDVENLPIRKGKKRRRRFNVCNCPFLEVVYILLMRC